MHSSAACVASCMAMAELQRVTFVSLSLERIHDEPTLQHALRELAEAAPRSVLDSVRAGIVVPQKALFQGHRSGCRRGGSCSLSTPRHLRTRFQFVGTAGAGAWLDALRDRKDSELFPSRWPTGCGCRRSRKPPVAGCSARAWKRSLTCLLVSMRRRPFLASQCASPTLVPGGSRRKTKNGLLPPPGRTTKVHAPSPRAVAAVPRSGRPGGTGRTPRPCIMSPRVGCNRTAWRRAPGTQGPFGFAMRSSSGTIWTRRPLAGRPCSHSCDHHTEHEFFGSLRESPRGAAPFAYPGGPSRRLVVGWLERGAMLAVSCSFLT